MPTDKDIARGLTRKSKTAPPPPAIESGKVYASIEDTPTSRLAMGISRGKWTGRGALNNPRRERAERPRRRLLPLPSSLMSGRYPRLAAILLRHRAPEPPRTPLQLQLPPPKGLAVIRAERALQKRREKWGDRSKPDHVTDYQWKIRRRIEVEDERQVDIAADLGISQAMVSKLYRKSRG